MYHPLAAPAQQMHVLAPALMAHHQKSFHAFGITHHFTGAQLELVFVVVLALAVLGVILKLQRSS